MFKHSDVEFDSLTRENIDGVRYYKVPGSGELVKLPSITSVISHRNREKFREWEEKVGLEEANRIRRKSTSRVLMLTH